VAGLDEAARATLEERTTYFLTKFPLVGVLRGADPSEL